LLISFKATEIAPGPAEGPSTGVQNLSARRFSPINGLPPARTLAGNPTEWMFHRHNLEHAVGGMMGTVAVE